MRSNFNEDDYAIEKFAISSERFPEASDAERRKLYEVAKRLRAENPKLDRTALFGADVKKGFGREAAIIIGNSLEIPLIGYKKGHQLEYRMGYLASEGDLIVVCGSDCPSFEQYQRNILKLASLEYLRLGASMMSSAPGYCLRNKSAYDTLCRYVRRNHGATFVSYLTTQATWALASRLANETQYQVFIAGPPGGLSDCANNKLWFAKSVERSLGVQAIPPKRTANGAAVLVRQVMELAKKWPKLVLKVPNSAGSAGNYVIHTKDVKGLGALAVSTYLRARLRHLGWPGRFPLAVEVWDENVLTSPSVQLWIPHQEHGDPMVEGVFEQKLVGEEGAYFGASQAKLPSSVDGALCAQAFKLGLLFQRLGYYGRCSFDAVLYGPNIEHSKIHWIECNARWGGVSIPMSLIKRRNFSACYTITQAGGLQNPKRRFEDTLIEFDDVVLPNNGEQGIVFLNPNGVLDGTGCQFLALGQTLFDTLALSKQTYDRLCNEPIA